MFNTLRVLLISSCVVGACSSIARADVVTVPNVDLSRYAGLWYEIGSNPTWFQRNCHCTTAKYDLRPDGKVAVVNSCRRPSVDSDNDTIHGTARVVDTDSNARLLVSFFWPMAGSYNIIGLDADYRWAVVTDDRAKMLWILSRTPVLESPMLEAAWAAATAQVDVSRFHFTVQSGCPK